MNNDITDLFETAGMPLDGIVDSEQIIDFDLDGIDKSSADDATEMVQNLSKFYYNEEFMTANPTFKKRVDADLESLRILIKMRKSDEIAHDNLLKAIASNSSNASLYRSLTEMQKTIISITTKMGEIIVGLNNLMKGFQLEINFQDQTNDQQSDVDEDFSVSKDTHRGSKEFINMMNNIDDLFTDEEIPDDKIQKEDLN